MNLQIATVISTVGTFYGWLIIAYVLMTWIPLKGILNEIHQVLATLVEPYLGLFRRFIPPIGAVDISPLVAYFVWRLLVQVIARAVAGL